VDVTDFERQARQAQQETFRQAFHILAAAAADEMPANQKQQSERRDRLTRAQECSFRAAVSARETARVETKRGVRHALRNLVQALRAAPAVSALGYLLWITQRPYEE
jgi:3-methyladenine DNA glycosylase AlkC